MLNVPFREKTEALSTDSFMSMMPFLEGDWLIYPHKEYNFFKR